MQPIFELEIANEIIRTIRMANISFYQRELSYSHCDIANQLEESAYNGKTEEEKMRCRIQSLPFCNGEIIIPLLKKLRQGNHSYYSFASLSLFYQLSMVAVTNIVNNSFFEELLIGSEEDKKQYEEIEHLRLRQEQLFFFFDMRLQTLLSTYTKDKQKENLKQDTINKIGSSLI